MCDTKAETVAFTNTSKAADASDQPIQVTAPAASSGNSALQRHRKPRLFYLDWVRALSVLLIVVTHFNNPFLANKPIFVNSPFGIYIGSLGVSQFLIISGAALMYNYEDEEHLNLKVFYWKRFKSIYPMFWIAFIIANVYLMIHAGVIAARAPKWTLILSAVGMDGYLANAGFHTFYTLGEWFLGFIVLFYVIFPILRYGVKNHPWATAAIGLILYALTLLLHIPVHHMPQDLLLTTRLPELLFGMYFVRFIKKVPHWLGGVSVVLLVLQQIFKPVKGDLAVTLVGLCFFLFLVWISQWLDIRPIRKIIGSLSKYSYAIFLVHHQVIIQVFTAVNPATLNPIGAYILFFADFVIIMALSVALQVLNKKTLAYVKAMFARPWRERITQ
ncbi:acyltransferase [Bifidobacterium sp. ESL0704]|uniref:acyltransferase family protein n=1 Tax=Bifidobacterium sp. ESL0704 TaxID=2983219 RepID=UPI0023F74DFD|nr:acyltransferase [Bifidobacterium sp. ESL0704]WEV53129.1 acyltransferase [Bifidobacterium sp. ESL0704]